MSDSNTKKNEPRGALLSRLIADPVVRHRLMAEIAKATQIQFEEYRPDFLASLTLFDQAVYRQAARVPYAPKDWWRDAHDIVVTWSVMTIVSDENQRRCRENSQDLLPEWLVTAALLHDRGYGILAYQGHADSLEYIGRSGAHWERVDTRLLHSLLSRKFAEALLFEPAFEDAFPDLSLPAIEKVSGFMPEHDRDLFLKVIETHDHPLIGRFEELPEIGWHHFDADSLYSVSLSSFVKDYLCYLSDPGKLEKAYNGGICCPGEYLPRTLLSTRMARYFQLTESLPEDWDNQLFPLLPDFSRMCEGGCCMPPSSPIAKEMTELAFLKLAECCVKMESADSIEDFIAWFNASLVAQFAELHARVPGRHGSR